jgi:hypothetical protein
LWLLLGDATVGLAPLFPDTLMVGIEIRTKVKEYVRLRILGLREKEKMVRCPCCDWRLRCSSVDVALCVTVCALCVWLATEIAVLMNCVGACVVAVRERVSPARQLDEVPGELL